MLILLLKETPVLKNKQKAMETNSKFRIKFYLIILCLSIVGSYLTVLFGGTIHSQSQSGSALVLTQNNNTISASAATGFTLTDFAYFKSSTNPTCTSAGTYGNTGTSTTLTDKQWVCFRAKKSDNSYVYAKLQARPDQTSSDANSN